MIITEKSKRNNDQQHTTEKTKDWPTRTPLKTNNDLQNITEKTKDWPTWTPLKTNNDLQNNAKLDDYVDLIF
jgi:BRCT domain type II-containing protein